MQAPSSNKVTFAFKQAIFLELVLRHLGGGGCAVGSLGLADCSSLKVEQLR